MKFFIIGKDCNLKYMRELLSGETIEIGDLDSEYIIMKNDHRYIMCLNSGVRVIIPLDRVEAVYSEGRYNFVSVINGDKFRTINTLTDLTEILPANFSRISRAVIINQNYIQIVRSTYNMKYIVETKSGNNYIVTRSYYHSFKEYLV